MSSLSHCRHWIFDMDGTLTKAVHDFDAIRKILGIEQGVPILEAIDSMPAAQALEKTQQLHALEMDIAADSSPQPGAVEVLSALQNRGFSLGILTRNAEDIAHTTLVAAGLDNFFTNQAVIGRERCTPKPDPAGIKLLLDYWNASTTETVIVGDYRFDLESGRNANISTVHFDVGGVYAWPEMTDINISRLESLLQQL